MKNMKFLWIVVVGLLTALPATRAQDLKKSAGKYVINLGDSKVNWTGKKPGGAHEGFVSLASGELNVDNNEIKGGSFVIDLGSIVNTDLKDENMNGKLIGHLKSADFFDVAKFPTARFEITKVTKLSGNAATRAPKSTHNIEGNLTMKGITKKVSFDASINMLNGKLTASSLPFTIDRTQWGVNYQSKSIFAELKDQFIYDDITLTVDLVTK